MDKLKQLQEVSERAERAQVAWAEYWAGLGEADADPVVFDPLQIERVAARKAYSDAKEALVCSILDGSFLDDETVERAAAAMAEPLLREFDGYRLDTPLSWEKVPENDRKTILSLARAALQAALGGAAGGDDGE